MLSWFAITYNTARLGFEAQNAAALRLLRLAGGLSKAAANEINLEQINARYGSPSINDADCAEKAPARREKDREEIGSHSQARQAGQVKVLMKAPRSGGGAPLRRP